MINVRNIGKEGEKKHSWIPEQKWTSNKTKKKRMRNYDSNNNNNFLVKYQSQSLEQERWEKKNDLAFFLLFTTPFSYNIDTNVNDCHE